MSAFSKAIPFILSHEEEFARGHWGDENYVVAENVEGDNGGVTKFGLDAASHPGVDIASLTRDQAVAMYEKEWDRHNLDALPEKLAIAAFDVWVNGGHANTWLQQAFNLTHPDRPQLEVDGELGPKSITALYGSDQEKILHVFLAERDARFKTLASNPRMEKFLAGWLQRDADLRAYLTA